MLIDSDEKYIPSLRKLWHEVFGDEYEYIDLFFKKAYFQSECFAEIKDDEIISALYLLNAKIRCGGQVFTGRYLYAASTLPQFRGKGIMSELLKQVNEFAREKKLDFIALVPASDSLYNYYSKFGYDRAMYKYKISSLSQSDNYQSLYEIESASEFYKMRSSLADNMLFYDEVISEYAFDCLKFSGKSFYRLSDKSYYIQGEELFYSLDDENFCHNLPKEIGSCEIFSNKAFGTGEKVKNGMIHPINKKLKNKEIYMNIALD